MLRVITSRLRKSDDGWQIIKKQPPISASARSRQRLGLRPRTCRSRCLRVWVRVEFKSSRAKRRNMKQHMFATTNLQLILETTRSRRPLGLRPRTRRSRCLRLWSGLFGVRRARRKHHTTRSGLQSCRFIKQHAILVKTVVARTHLQETTRRFVLWSRRRGTG